MPEYLIRFDQEVQYQPDHPKVRKHTSAICVHAPTPESAITHALRVTRGAGAVLSVVDVQDAPEEAAMVRMMLTVQPTVPVDEHQPEGAYVSGQRLIPAEKAVDVRAS